MRELTFTIPYPPTAKGKQRWAREYGMNAYYAGKHWARRQQDAKDWHMMTRAAVRKAGWTGDLMQKPVVVSFWWDDGLDIDNHSVMGKMIVDALKGLVIADDNRRHLVGVAHHFHDGGAIVVTVQEVDG